MTVEKDALLHFKHRHAFESTDFDRCDILPLVKWEWKKYFARRDDNLEAIIDRGWFHLEIILLKEPVILKTKIRLENDQLDNKNDLPLRTNPPIPESIITDKLTIIIDLTLPLNLPSLLSLDLNTYEGAADKLAIDYFQMIRNNNKVKDKYKAIIDKGEKFQMNLKDALKGRTLTAGALYICGISVLGKDIREYKKDKQI